MSLDSLKERWETLEKIPFPESLIGKRPGGENLLLLESDLGAAILAVVFSEGKPSSRTLITLDQKIESLKNALSDIDDDNSRKYFDELLALAELALSVSAPRKSLLEKKE